MRLAGVVCLLWLMHALAFVVVWDTLHPFVDQATDGLNRVSEALHG